MVNNIRLIIPVGTDELSTEIRNKELKRCHLIFDDLGKDLWVGTFQNAQKIEPKLKYLANECCVCWDTFNPKDKVVVFPCTHGLHENCFRSLVSRVCPYDNTRVDFFKISCLSYSILFTLETNHFGKELYENKEKINEKISNVISMLITNEKYQPYFSGLIPSNTLRLLNVLIQDAINRYSILTTPKLYRVQYIQDLLNNLVEVTTTSSNRKAADIDFLIDTNIFELFGRKKLNLRECIKLATYLMDISAKKLHGIKLISVIGYIVDEVIFDMMNLPIMSKFIERVEQRFLSLRFKEIRVQPTLAKKVEYVSRMRTSDLKRLNRLTKNGKGEISKLIENQVYKRNNFRILKMTIIALLALIMLSLLVKKFINFEPQPFLEQEPNYVLFTPCELQSIRLCEERFVHYNCYPDEQLSKCAGRIGKLMFEICGPKDSYLDCEAKTLKLMCR